MFMVNISTVPNLKQGDEVTLIGRDGMHEISIDQWSTWLNTINHETPTLLKAHIPRITVGT